ncbi:ferrochelatase [Hyphobacterium marinum]|uniref:Ferrochelatase n=1 Tax=Hyphobacterium marinum TaxID=3116574 RepID=A0ABU7LV12_9PROT|nr:ferrochelatase [Hyphobacterium sp. Y6023]MEE2565374.1 ferrochelatase [Hyphobacterium sp. Y6023]
MSRKIAVVLFNLGGPDGQADVKPFLRYLFRDPAIIGAPGPIREFLAWLISTRREREAQANYALMGGGSPLLTETRSQADALTKRLNQSGDSEFRVFIAMRYWHPFVEEAVREVATWGPDETVLLPLYPQFSTTTTGSSLKAWKDAGGGAARTVCCYPENEDFISAHAALIAQSWEKAGRPENTRLLFSAHGLPERVIAAGDPYQFQVERTAAAIADRLPQLTDWQICYQSRVGPLTWIGPATEDSIREAAEVDRHILLVPIAFVSEHIETLVELDIEYRELAKDTRPGVGYTRVPALGVADGYVTALSGLVSGALEGPAGMKPPNGQRLCPADRSQCPCAGMETR